MSEFWWQSRSPIKCRDFFRIRHYWEMQKVVNGYSFILICQMVRRALVEVCTVPVLLIKKYILLNLLFIIERQRQWHNLWFCFYFNNGVWWLLVSLFYVITCSLYSCVENYYQVIEIHLSTTWLLQELCQYWSIVLFVMISEYALFAYN